jgi:hypothetical protein
MNPKNGEDTRLCSDTLRWCARRVDEMGLKDIGAWLRRTADEHESPVKDPDTVLFWVVTCPLCGDDDEMLNFAAKACPGAGCPKCGKQDYDQHFVAVTPAMLRDLKLSTSSKGLIAEAVRR